MNESASQARAHTPQTGHNCLSTGGMPTAVSRAESKSQTKPCSRHTHGQKYPLQHSQLGPRQRQGARQPGASGVEGLQLCKVPKLRGKCTSQPRVACPHEPPPHTRAHKRNCVTVHTTAHTSHTKGTVKDTQRAKGLTSQQAGAPHSTNTHSIAPAHEGTQVRPAGWEGSTLGLAAPHRWRPRGSKDIGIHLQS